MKLTNYNLMNWNKERKYLLPNNFLVFSIFLNIFGGLPFSLSRILDQAKVFSYISYNKFQQVIECFMKIGIEVQTEIVKQISKTQQKRTLIL